MAPSTSREWADLRRIGLAVLGFWHTCAQPSGSARGGHRIRPAYEFGGSCRWFPCRGAFGRATLGGVIAPEPRRSCTAVAGSLMIQSIVTRVGPLGVSVLERNGHWRAWLLGGPLCWGGVASASAGPADGAVANWGGAVEAALAPALRVGLPDPPAFPAGG